MLLSEKSTYAGIVTMLGSSTAFGLGLGFWQAVATGISGLAGLAMTFMLEKGDKEKLEKEQLEREMAAQAQPRDAFQKHFGPRP
jgi:hypothetical protein